MDINSIDPKALEFTKEELDALAKILVLAKQIQEDHTLNSLVTKHANKTVTEFKSIDDLKTHSKNMANKTEKMSTESKPTSEDKNDNDGDEK